MDDRTLELLRSNLLSVFGERDATRRAEAAERTYAADVTFSDEEGTVSGVGAVVAKAGAILDRLPPDVVFAEEGPAYGDSRRAALRWRLGPPDGDAVARGLDVVTVDGDRITELETFLAT